ncbi:MAG: carboxypeptidase-like regulatory domain-containing protein [Bryobacteraceae bacterium]
MRSLFVAMTVAVCAAAGHQGQVKFNGLPVPGVAVTATQGDSRIVTSTDQTGVYTFLELADGAWKVSVGMSGFATIEREIMVAEGAAAAEWELKMLSLDEMNAQAAAQRPPPPSPPPPAATDQPKPAAAAKPTPQRPASEVFANVDPDELRQRAADGFLVNGTANNAATSPFSLAAAFGNSRNNRRALYNTMLGVIAGNSALDARPFSLTGQLMPKPEYNRLQGLFSFGGPIRIPRLIRNGPNLTVNYQWTRRRNATTQTALMPLAAERNGNLSHLRGTIFDPATGAPFAGNIIPQNRISPQARALLDLYPAPNFDTTALYNYQVPIAGNMHQDALQTRVTHRLPRRNQLVGNLAFQSARTDDPNLFGFLPTSRSKGMTTGLSWVRMPGPRFYTVLGYQFNRATARTTPFFSNRRNVSGEAGISGNNQDPVNWGPPALNFSGGFANLTDALFSSSRDQTSGFSLDVGMNRARHNILLGGEYRRQQFNLLSQEDPRGTFTFTGASTQAIVNGVPVAGTGSDFAGFLLGIPDTSAIAFGNADKYFRSATAALYATDDWRIRTGLTVNAGVRWEYGSPIHELYGRLVNLDIVPGFAAVAPVVAGNPSGSLTGVQYPRSLVRPDRNNVAPRIGFAWRPLAASSLLIRGGYGIYYDNNIYRAIAVLMAQQSPLSTSLRVQNSAGNPLTLASGFRAPPNVTRNTFAIDPGFRAGYSQNWQASVQRDMPASLVVIATYLAVKGTRGQQQFLPNTYPAGAPNLCPACPAGFAYLVSNGNSTRQAGVIEVRRRLRAGFTATVQYTYSKSIDNAALGGRNQGGVLMAQNWLDLRAERALSNFDQRHLVSFQTQYTTGMARAGGMLLGGWRGVLFKEWSFATQITSGSGLPLSPRYPTPVAGTGVTSTVRPDYTGAPLYAPPPGFFLNPAAYVAPGVGRWGNAGRNSITGPSTFTMDASLSRTFRMGDRLNLDFRIDAANALNRAVFPSWNTIATSSQFGLPNPANAMRTVQTTARFRF